MQESTESSCDNSELESPWELPGDRIHLWTVHIFRVGKTPPRASHCPSGFCLLMPRYGLAPCFPKEKTPGHPQSSLDPHSSLVPVHLIMSKCLLKHSADPCPKAPEGAWSLPRGRLGADTLCRREIIFLWRSPDVILASKGSHILSFTCPSKSTHMLSSGPFKMRTPPEELLSNMLEKTSLCELGSSLLPC